MTNFPAPESSPVRHTSAETRAHRQTFTGANAGIAVALGGGFSRGFAHLGVLEVLEQERLPISAIIGTSIGGLLGAAYADGISIRELCELGRQVRVRDFLRFQSPAHAAQKNDRIGRFVREWFRASQVEELCIPTVIVTTDLETGAPHLFARGPLDVAIRASCAFPGLFKPVEYEGRMLADGCIVAPVPTAVAAQMNAACVLGVAVGSHEKNASSGRNIIRVFHRAFRTLKKGLLQPSWSTKADVLLEPEVQQIDWNDFTRVDEARAAGAEAMRRALPYVRELLDRQVQLRPVEGTSGRVESGLAS